MNLRVIAVLVMVVLLAGALWVWLGSTRSQGLGPPPTMSQSLSPSEAMDAVLAAKSAAEEDTRAPASKVVDAAVPPPSTTPFALVRVLVVDKLTHRPLVGVQVHASYGKGGPLEQTSTARGKPLQMLPTDADGRVEIEMVPDVAFTVSGSGRDRSIGYASVEVPPISAGANHEVVLELPTGKDMPFWLKIVDEETKTPIVGARVSALVSRSNEPTIASDARGFALFEASSWDQSHLCIESEGLSKKYVATESGHAREEAAFVVSMSRTSTLRLRAVDGAAPIIGVGIDLTTPTYNLYSGQWHVWNYEPDPHWRASTNESGRATITDLPARVPLVASINNRARWTAPDPLVLEPGEVRDVEWNISNGCDVRGRLIDQEGRTVSGHVIWLRKADIPSPILFQSYHDRDSTKTATNEEGRFEFLDVSPGVWWVGPAAKESSGSEYSHEIAPSAQVLEISGTQSVIDLTLRADRGLFITGSVLSASGTPAESSYVRAYEKTLKLSASSRTSSSKGVFRIGPLMNGVYSVSAHGSGGDSDSELVEARAGEDGVVLRLRPGASLSGRVVGEDGKGVAGFVNIANHDPLATGPYHLSVNNDGVFQMQGLSPGVFDLAATTSNGWIGFIEPVEIGPGGAAKDLLIRVAPGGHVRVRHEGPSKFAKIGLLQRGVVVSGGWLGQDKSEEYPSPAGSIVVRARYLTDDSFAVERTVERTVEVKLGETVDVTFEKGAH